MNTLYYRRCGLWIVLALLQVGCKNAPETATLDRIDASITDGLNKQQGTARRTEPPPPSLLAMPQPTPTIKPEPDQHHFDISVHDVPAAQFFASLVDGTRYNMVVHPEVQGSVSLNLKNVTVQDVLEAAQDVYGYQFEHTGYGYRVLPGRLQARIYQINYLNINRTGQSSTYVSAGTLDRKQNGMNGMNGNQWQGSNNAMNIPTGSGNTGFGNQGGSPQGSRGRAMIPGTQISTSQPDTSFWDEIKRALESIIAGGEGRSVVVNQQSGVIVVRALPTELRDVETFLRSTQLVTQRQVILEAKILEVTLNERFQSGINWAAMSGDFQLGQNGGGKVFGNSTASDLPSGSGSMLAAPNSAINNALASAFGGVFSLAVSGRDFGAFIELLKSQGNVQVLSSPRIATTNNQKAVIKVGTDEFFVTDVSTTTVTGTATTTTPNVELTPFFSGIALDVTPQISANSMVTLHIHPSVSQVTDQQKNIKVGNVEQSIPLARSTVRESDSIVRALSGQVVVIGGLMQDRTDDLRAQAPALGDVPLFGPLFRHQSNQSQKSELVILLKPVVVDSNDGWAQALQTSDSGVTHLRDELQRWERERSGSLETFTAP